MASIIKRGEYQYQATVRRKGFPQQCKTFESERKARDWASVIESEMVRGVFTDRSELERTTLGELLGRYKQEVTPSKIGARQELSRIKLWEAHPLALRPLATLRAVDFSQYRDARLKKVGPNTVRLELALISALFKRKGNCCDNAPTERFFDSLQNERVLGTRYSMRADAETDPFDSIEPFYNRRRRHSTLGYPPIKFVENWISTGPVFGMSSNWRHNAFGFENEK